MRGQKLSILLWALVLAGAILLVCSFSFAVHLLPTLDPTPATIARDTAYALASGLSARTGLLLAALGGVGFGVRRLLRRHWPRS